MRRPPYNIRAGAKRIWANMKDMGLALPPDRRREPVTAGHIYTEEPNRRWATDLTTVYTELDGTVAINPVVDCGCRTAPSAMRLRLTAAGELYWNRRRQAQTPTPRRRT